MKLKQNRRLFYVIQFMELPFKCIHNIVIVPHWWIINQIPPLKALVTYPSNEDHLTTEGRVKRRERPNDEWRFYMAYIKYQSKDYKDAENWMRHDHRPSEEVSEMEGTQSENVLNRQLRSADQRVWLSTNLNKPHQAVESYKNSRKPLPRISVKRPLPQSSDKNLDNKLLKVDENVKPITYPKIIRTPCLEQEPSVVVTDNKLIQNNKEMNSVQHIQPRLIEDNQSIIDLSVKTSSKKVLVDRQSPPMILDKLQVSPKLPATAQTLPKLPVSQQPLQVVPEPQNDVDKFNNNESCEYFQTEPKRIITEEKTSTTPLINLEHVPQSEIIHEKSFLLAHYDQLNPKPHQQGVSVEQFKVPYIIQRIHPNWASTPPMVVPPTPSTSNQHSPPLANFNLPVSSVSYSKPKPQNTIERKLTKGAHDHQNSLPQGLIHSTSSRFSHELHWKDSLISLANKQAPVVETLNVDKEICLGAAAKDVSTQRYLPNAVVKYALSGGSKVMEAAQLSQTPLQQAQTDGSLLREKVSHPQNSMNTPATQNLLNLARQFRPFETSCDQQCLPAQEYYSQQFVHLQDSVERPIMAQPIVQRAYHQNAIINGGFAVQNQPNVINQPIHISPRTESQNIPVNSSYLQEIMRHELMRSLDGAHITYKSDVQNGVSPLSAHVLSNQFHQNFEHLHQKPNSSIYHELYTENVHQSTPIQWKYSSGILMPQSVTKRTSTPSTLQTPIQALPEVHENRYINVAALPENILVNPVTITQSSDDQTIPSPARPQNTPSVPRGNHDDRHPSTRKIMVDRATETDPIISDCVDDVARSSVSGVTQKVVNSPSQMNVCPEAEQEPFVQDTTSDSDVSLHESESETEEEVNEPTLATIQNSTTDNERLQSTLDRKDILSVLGTLFTQMETNLSVTRDMFEVLRNSMIGCAKTYKTLLEKIDQSNSAEILQSVMSPSHSGTAQFSQVTKEKPVGDNNKIDSTDSPSPKPEKRGTFSLPAEYDPNDTKWTLKYRQEKRGLVELLPRTGIYVSKKGLTRCIRKSTDCRSLARLLLMEVFTRNALSVCSLTGTKAKPFNSVNIDVRPGLDENARMVLLSFVEEHGKKHGWVTSDTPAIISTIRTKIRHMRTKYG